jgi:hypothetical protein
MRGFLALLSLWAACLATAAAHAAVVTVSSSNRDTTIFQGSSGNSGGGQTQMYAGTNGNGDSGDRALLSFDLTGVPAGTVQSVTLSLNLSQVAGGGMTGTDPTPHEIDLFALARSWGEGTVNTGGGQGAAANAGDATWSNSASPSTAWTTAGGDHAAAISGAQLVGNVTGTIITWNSTATTLIGGATTLSNGSAVNNSQMVADVQSWLSHPATNFGWELINTDEVDAKTFRAFSSRESTTASLRPLLTITLVPEPGTLTIMACGAVGLAGVGLRRRHQITRGR